MPEDVPSELQLLSVAGEMMGCCSLPLSSFGRLAKDVIAELLRLDKEVFVLVGAKGKVDEGDMLCEVTEPDKRVLTVLFTAVNSTDP